MESESDQESSLENNIVNNPLDEEIELLPNIIQIPNNTDIKQLILYENPNKQNLIPKIEIDINKAETHKKIIIDDITIYFPFEPYIIQIEYMKLVLQALNTKNFAALESPTGTGKTLCLLCACLAWLYSQKTTIPKVFFSTRSHSETTNIIKELKKTCYKPTISILSSKHYSCVNPMMHKLKKEDRNKKCVELIKGKMEYYEDVNEYGVKTTKTKETLCEYFYSEKFSHDKEIFDIEDLCKLGIKEKFCPYYNEINRMRTTNITFLPYIYLLHPDIRKSMKINVNNAIILFDEAHNIQSICENIEHFVFNLKILDQIKNEFDAIKSGISISLSLNCEGDDKNDLISSMNKALKMEKYISSIKDKLDAIELTIEEQHAFKKGKILSLDEIENAFSGNEGKGGKIGFINLTGLYNYSFSKPATKKRIAEVNKMIGFVNKYKEQKKKMQKGEEDSFVFFLSEKKQKKKESGRTEKYLSLLCLNPGYFFNQITSNEPHSIILTSGTLSPINILEMELKCKFKIKLENDNIINKNQILFSCINSVKHKGYKDTKFEFTYSKRNNIKMFEDLGKSILKMIKVTPGGILVFFSSYLFMYLCMKNWTNSNLIKDFRKYKHIFRQNTNEKPTKQILKEYEECCNNEIGAVFFSVFRGGASEGINFSENASRLTILIGIPFFNLTDDLVQIKMKYLDFKAKKTKEENILLGLDWYISETMRTVNKALGRIIVGENDYGAIALIDIRYTQQNIINSISKWIRKFLSPPIDADSFCLQLGNFFEEKTSNVLISYKTIQMMIKEKYIYNIENVEKDEESIIKGGMLNIKRKRTKKNNNRNCASIDQWTMS